MAIYANLGWDGILAIQPNSKIPAEQFVTGRHPQLTAEECVWRSSLYPRHNIALRLPPNVIGLDVDDYDERGGAATLAKLQRRYGPLPAAPYSTARGAGPSGIRLYRLRKPVQLKSAIPGGIEIAQHHHRFVMVEPSIHPKTKEVYRWYAADGSLLDTPPKPADLPYLPSRYVAALRAFRRTSVPAPSAPLPSREEAPESLLGHIRAVAADIAALPRGSEANTPVNNAALKLSSYAPHDVSVEVIRAELRAAVDSWRDGHDRGYLAIEQGLSVVNGPQHEPRPWIDSEGAGFELVKG
ncbi:bifunctional DNA primase/polymerase [Streptomyces sp. NPDC127051]|uniref:bifunctional DNA primase/polymerase n=1 Tax=Streptomyces sp. NPDC127051 TaxID=3347119 RepID=UPI00364C21B5